MVPSRLASWTLVRAAERAYSKLAASRSQDRCRSSKSSFWRGRSPGEPENLWRGGGQMLTNVTSDWQCSSRGESGGFYELVSVDIRPPPPPPSQISLELTSCTSAILALVSLRCLWSRLCWASILCLSATSRASSSRDEATSSGSMMGDISAPESGLVQGSSL